ncbi:PAS domain-containing sensor histidine kinase [Carboxylicivirga sp. N1Y90]|uniref:PAS domain-containing sensor histidine kinase n=1 Tax=Carboxylicivirga fragile TaxID=3417571 RepID=UPI003D32BBEF|nr:PAS domain S-box protein [Marinilabiliaceae bacterium N1Y90]
MKILQPLRQLLVNQKKESEAVSKKPMTKHDTTLFSHAILNKEGIIIEASDNFLNLTGHSLRNLKGHSIKKVSSDGSFHNLLLTLKLLSEQHPFETNELVVVKQNGESILLEATFTYFSEGERNLIYTVFKDIDEDKKKILKLYSQKEQFKHLAINTSFVQILLDKNFKCLFISPSAVELSGYTLENLLEENLYKLVHPDDLSIVWETLNDKNIARQQTLHFRFKHSSGTNIPIECDLRTVNDEFGMVKSFVLNIQDITQQKQNEQDLINSRKAAEASNLVKNNFLTLVTHELRTPLNAIIGFSRILEKQVECNEYNNYIKSIEENGQQLLGLIDNIVDFAQLDVSQYKIVAKKINLDAFFRQIASNIKRDQKLLHKDNLEIIASWELDDVHNYLISDQLLLLKIFKNLLDNAIKFTKEGFVKYGCKPYGIRAYLFFVEDSGIGIPDKEQDIIFEKFHQKDQTNSRQYGGMGIGLTVCKQMVEQLGGEIWLKSEDGKGSSFYFTLPIIPKDTIIQSTTN